MADLATTQRRGAQQRRLTTNADRTIAVRRPDTPDLEVNARITAPRSSADEVRQALGMFDDIVGAAGSFFGGQARTRQANDTAQGTLDATAGQVDGKRQADSAAYRNAVTLTNARTALEEVNLSIETELDAWIAEGKDGNGDGKFDLDDVRGMIDRKYRAVALDADGKPRDFGEARANLAFAQELSQARPKFMAAATKAIAEREHTNLVTSQAALMVADFRKPGEDGKPRATYDIDAYVAALPPQIDRTKAKAVFLQAAVNDADEAGNYKALDALADTKKRDGSPAFTPQEVARIRDQRDAIRTRVEREAEKARSERYEETTMGFLGRLASGKSVSRGDILSALNDDRIPANTALTLVDRLDREAAEARAEARAVRAEARDIADRNAEFQMVGVKELWRAGGGPTDPAGALRVATDMFRRGRLGSGTMAIRNMEELLTASRQGRATVASRPDVRQFGALVDQTFAKPKTGAGIRGRLGGGLAIDPNVTATHAAALSYYRGLTLDQGIGGAQAYQETIQKFGGGPRPAGRTPAGGAPSAAAARLRELESRRGR